MIGFDAAAGKYLSGNDHLRQSVNDILTTPLGTRVLLRDYGSGLFELVDQPEGDTLRVRIVQAVATALERWEPRLAVKKVEVSFVSAGHYWLTIIGTNTETRETQRLEGIEIDGIAGHY